MTVSADTTTTATGIASNGLPLPTVTTPQFQGVSGAVNANFSTCAVNSLTDPATQIAQILANRGSKTGSQYGGGTKTGTTQGGGCDVQPPSSSDLKDCTNYQDSSGNFDPSLVTQKKKEIDQMQSDAKACQDGLNSIQKQIQCLKDAGNQLTSQINGMAGIFQTNIQRFQKDVTSINSMESDRKNQATTIDQKLNGGGNSGDGLIATRARLEALVNGMGAKIQAANDEYIAITNAQTALNEQAQNRTMALTGTCFSQTPMANYRCPSIDSPPMSPEAFIICRYQQVMGLDPNGNLSNTSTASTDAQAQAQGLQTVLGQIMSSISSQANIPLTQQDATSQLNTTVSAITPADIQSQYGSQLTQYNGRGIQVSAFVMQSFQYCYAKSQNQVALERTEANTSLGIAAAQIAQRQRTNATDISNQIQAYSDEYAKDTAALSGQHIPLNATACANATPQVGVNCLTQIQATLTNLLNGNSSSSAVTINLPANNAGLVVNIPCNGIQGCITALQSAATNVQTATNQLKQFKTNYEQQATQSTQQFAQTLANQASSQSQQLNTMLQNINTKLASLGVSGGINLNRVTPEELTFQDDPDGGKGIPNMPKNMVNYIGGLSQPPLLDVSGESFSDSLSGIAQAQKTENKDASAVANAETALAGVLGKCKKQAYQDMISGLNQDTSNSGLADCLDDQACKKDSNSDDLYQELSNLGQQMGSGNQGTGTTNINSVLGGLGSACNKRPSYLVSYYLNQLTKGTNCPDPTSGNNVNYYQNCSQLAQYCGNLPCKDPNQNIACNGSCFPNFQKYNDAKTKASDGDTVGPMSSPACAALTNDISKDTNLVQSINSGNAGSANQ
jgi:hypothetical protein